ncbi:hypothetical protein FRC12_017865 [Ceratobasidium sp. 428]|nr:hypothetical protein FRC12_017865 [Ceratobasidium sp. 428]
MWPAPFFAAAESRRGFLRRLRPLGVFSSPLRKRKGQSSSSVIRLALLTTFQVPLVLRRVSDEDDEDEDDGEEYGSNGDVEGASDEDAEDEGESDGESEGESEGDDGVKKYRWDVVLEHSRKSFLSLCDLEKVQDAAHLEPMYDNGVPLYWTENKKKLSPISTCRSTRTSKPAVQSSTKS